MSDDCQELVLNNLPNISMITILTDNAIHQRLGIIIITLIQEPAKVTKSIKKATSDCLWILTR